MIILNRVTKAVGSGANGHNALSNVTMSIPTNRHIALFAQTPEDQLAFFDILTDVIPPDSGRVVRKCRVSFPVGVLAGFVNDLSVRLNVAYLARAYNTDAQTVVNLVDRHADIGQAFDKPYGNLSRVLRRQLGIIVSYSIPFDFYVLPRAPTRRTSVESAAYLMFQSRMRDSGMIVATSSHRFARKNCDMAIVMHHGQLVVFDDVDSACAVVEKLN